MKRIKVIELVNTTTNESLGYAPMLTEKGEKPQMFTDENGAIKFKTRKGMLYSFANLKPAAFFVLLTMYLIFIGKLYSLELFIKAFKLVPDPEIKIQAFFLTI